MSFVTVQIPGHWSVMDETRGQICNRKQSESKMDWQGGVEKGWKSLLMIWSYVHSGTQI